MTSQLTAWPLTCARTCTRVRAKSNVCLRMGVYGLYDRRDHVHVLYARRQKDQGADMLRFSRLWACVVRPRLRHGLLTLYGRPPARFLARDATRVTLKVTRHAPHSPTHEPASCCPPLLHTQEASQPRARQQSHTNLLRRRCTTALQRSSLV